MVCLGNICRSPLAEILLQHKVNTDQVKVDSAGTGDYHVGHSPDERSVEIAQRHGHDIKHLRGRQFEPSDFADFDYIFVMDASNYSDVLLQAPTEKDREKVSMILSQSFPGQQKDVPDPYFGEEDGFKTVYDLLDEATTIIAEKLSDHDAQWFSVKNRQ